MPSCSGPVTPSRFERRVPRGQLDRIFVPLGSDATIARLLRVSKMTVWRWRHDRAPLPEWVLQALRGLVHSKVVEAHEAESALSYFVALPPRPPRRLTGCCTGYLRKPKSRHYVL